MPDTLVLEAREVGKTKLARASRAAGKVPGVLYGRGADPVAFEVEIPALREALSGEAGRHAVLKLQVPGRKGDTHAVLKDYQLDPVRDRLIHIDLLEISMSEKITSTVNVRLDGEAQGVKDGGVLEQASHELEVEALPADLPPEIVVDVSELVAGNAIRVADISLPAGVVFKSDPETVVAAVMQASTMDQIEAEQAAEAEALGLVPEEGEAGEPGEAEGEAAAADEDAAPASE
jgi:large subunit ribosomal protein L25